MSVKDRRQREKQLLRQEILDAARTLFVHDGYDNVSMRKIAEKIDYSPTTIYLYFKDKSDLMYAVCEETFARLIREFNRLEKDMGDPVQALKKGLHAYVDFGLRNPQHYLLCFVLPHPHEPHPERYVERDAIGMQAFAFLVRLVEACVAQKRFRRLDIQVASQALWTAIHGVTAAMIVHPEFPWVKREAVISQVIDSLVAGMEA